MKNKDEALEALQDRRAGHAGRQQALEDAKAAHKALENFLIQFETPPASAKPEQQQPESPKSPEREVGEGQSQQSRKRARTPSTPPHSHKRPRLVKQDKRHVNFHDSVVFRDEQDSRPEQAFNRGSEEYAPGRNAPAETVQYLDTSGFSTTATSFFGVRKNKKRWIRTKEGKEMDELWRSKTVGEQEMEATTTVIGSCGEDSGDGGADLATGDDPHASSEGIQNVEEEQVLKHACSPHILDIAATSDVVDNANEGVEAPVREEDMDEKQQTHATPNESHTSCSTHNDTPANSDPQRRPESKSSEDNDTLFTYGHGWSKKASPKSQPKGVRWKLGVECSLTRHEKREHMCRGRQMRDGEKFPLDAVPSDAKSDEER